MSSNTQQDETSFQANNLITDAPPTYTEAVHHLSINGQRHHQTPPPYNPVELTEQVHQTGYPRSPPLPTSSEQVVVVVPPQPAGVRVITRTPHVRYYGSIGSEENVKNRVNSRLHGVLCCTVFLFFCGTPLTLLVTLPSLFCVCQAKADVKRGKLAKANHDSNIGCTAVTVLVIITLFVVYPFCVSPGVVIGANNGLS